jgi:hypothetical protein
MLTPLLGYSIHPLCFREVPQHNLPLRAAPLFHDFKTMLVMRDHADSHADSESPESESELLLSLLFGAR